MGCGVCGIDYGSYFNQECKLYKHIVSDSDFAPDELSTEPITILTRISGGERFYRNEDNQLTVAERVYKTLYPVAVKDVIDGQTVVYVKAVYEFDGSLAFYKVFV